jgi:uracil phosphoribosyltransferase
LQHTLASTILTRLRMESTPPEQFRTLTRVLTQILIVEATRDLACRDVTVSTPLEPTRGSELVGDPVLVPILRAGLGMLDAALELLPSATVGYVGLQRDEATAIATSYYSKLPELVDRTVYLLDPMLATGGSACFAAEQLCAAGADRVVQISVVAAPEGVRRLQESFPRIRVVTAALDRELNDRKYILPGLGDFGDRLYGTL